MIMAIFNLKHYATMKNFFRSMMLVAVAAMGFAACSTENTNDPAIEFEPNMVEMSIIAEQTRTVLDSSEAYANWEADDQIAVFEVADAISITGSTETTLNERLASFRFSFEENTTASSFGYYAVYPYANVVSDSYKTMENIKLITPATQNPTATSFDGAADLLLSRPVTDLTAQPSEAMLMAFTRVVALAKMTLKNLNTTDPIINVTFTAPEGKVLAGRSYFNLTTGEAVEYGYSGQGTNTITLNYTGLANVAAGTPIYFTTLPTELVADENFTVTVSTENKKFTKEIQIPSDRSIAFVAGDMASFGVNMSGATEETIENLTGEYIIAGSNGKIMHSPSTTSTIYFTEYANATVSDVETATEFAYTDESIVWIVENGAVGQFYIKQKSSGEYVTWTSGNSGSLGTDAFALTIVKNNDGTCTITAVNDVNRKLQHNANSTRFAFYTGTQKDLYLIPAVASVEPLIEVAEQPAQVAAEGAEVSVNLTTANLTADITATTEAEWITGATVANDVLTFTVAANDTAERKATITLSANGAEATVNVSQAGKTAEGDPVEAYVKVTEALADYSGQYLIVYEAGSLAFNGSLTTLDATSNGSAVTITDNTIAASDAMHEISFTIAQSGTSYTIKSASNKYIGRTSNSNGFNEDASNALTNTITISNGTVTIAGSAGPTLQYNKASDQKRFRYFKSVTQQPIALYKLTTTGGGTDEPTTEQLATPVVTTSVADNVVTVSWEAVTNATSYDVTCGTESQTDVTGTSTTFTMDWGATYDVKVVAKSSDANYTASEAGTATAVVGAYPNAGGSEGGETEPITESLDVYGSNGSFSDKVITWESDNFTLSNAQSSSTTAIRTSDSDHFRAYQGNILTFTAKNSYTITKIIITCTSSSYATAMGNSLTGSSVSGSVVTWTGSAAEVSATMTTQSRFNKVEVTLEK